MSVRVFAAAAFGLALISQASADPVDDCFGGNPEKVIFGCLAIILGHVSGEQTLSDEDRAIVYYNLAVAEEDLNMVDKAIKSYGIAISINGRFPDPYVGRAALLVDRGENDKAIVDLDRAISLAPNEPEFYYHRARAYRGNGEFEKAEHDFTAAIRIDPHPAFYNARGSTRLRAGKLEEALVDFDRVIRLDPTMYVGHTNRGAVLVEKGELEAAIASYGKAIEASPQTGHVYTDRAQIYLRVGMPGEALRDCDTILSLDNDFSLAHYVRGLAHEALGETDRAITDFRRHLALEPDSEEGKAALARLGATE